MTEAKLISPMLDNFEIGGPISDHDGVRCYPAMRKNTEGKYIVKVISVPASQTKLDALLLTGVYSSKEDALVYFEELANEIVGEKKVLDELSGLEGFVPYQDVQIVPKDDATGFDVYLLSEYRMTLERHIAKSPLTQLSAVNLGLDLCAALSACRRSGYMCVDIKPSNIVLTEAKEFRVADLGFVRLNSLQYASLPDKYRSQYTAPEAEDAFSSLNETMDIYAVGLVLYQVFNAGKLPFDEAVAPKQKFDAPVYADAEMAEIILKACAPEASERWQDPVEMGQAIVNYMQKNGVNDTPLNAAIYGLQEETDVPETESFVSAVAEAADLLLQITEEPQNETEETENTAEAPVEEALDDTDAEETEAEETEAKETEAEEILDEVVAEEPETDEALVIPAVKPDDETEIPDIIIDVPVAVDTAEPKEDIEIESVAEADEQTSEETLAADDEAVTSAADELAEMVSAFEEFDSDETDVLKDAPEDDIEVDYDEVSDEISSMLSQIDELAAHQIPEPVVAPEAIEIKLPEPQPEETVEADDSSENAADSIEEAQDDADTSVEPTPPEELPYVPKKKRTGLKVCITLLILLGLLVGGYFFYQEYYLQPIHTLTLEGVEDRLQVKLTADIDETYLTVVCADSHGNKIPAPVVGGAAAFSGLMPDTAYTVTVEVDGFHKLTGTTSKVYSTPMQSKIAQFNAVTGAENGSVILSFAVEGPDSDQWNVIYNADGEAERVTTFPSHMVTLTGLTVGKEYTFRLEPVDEIFLGNEAEIAYIAKNVVYAENLRVIACTDGILTAQWDTPADIDVATWSVRCYNDAGYDETVLTEDTTIMFENIDDTSGYTVEVTAADMSVNRRVIVSPNSITVTDFTVDNSRSDMLQLNWAANRDIPAEGWTLQYSIDGVNAAEPIKSGANSAQVAIVPNGNYHFTLLDGAGNAVLGGPFTHAQTDAADFDAFSVTREDLTTRLCKTPAASSWSYKDLEDEDYVNSFAAGQKISAVIALSGRVERSDNEVLITYAIRDEAGTLVSFSHDTQTWRSMWYENYCELDVSAIPANVGTYELTVYFNGQTVGSQMFEITA